MPKGNSKIDPEEQERMASLRKWWKRELYTEISTEVLKFVETSRKIKEEMARIEMVDRLDREKSIVILATAFPIFVLWILSMK